MRSSPPHPPCSPSPLLRRRLAVINFQALGFLIFAKCFADATERFCMFFQVVRLFFELQRYSLRVWGWSGFVLVRKAQPW